MNPGNLVKTDVKRPITLTLSNGHKVHAHTLDISEQGLSIIYAAPASIGAHIGLHFSLVVNNQIHDFNLTGRVVFCHLRATSYHVGFMFDNISDTQKRTIDRFIDYKRVQKSATG